METVPRSESTHADQLERVFQSQQRDEVMAALGRAEYEALLARITEALSFAEAIGMHDAGSLGTVEWYSSHEGPYSLRKWTRKACFGAVL